MSKPAVSRFTSILQEELEKAHSDVPPCGYTPPTRIRPKAEEKSMAVVKRHLREVAE